MQQVRNSHHVDAPPEVVWPFVWDAELRPQWEVGVKAVKDVHGPLDEVGGTWTEVRKAPLGRTFEAAVTVKDVEPLRMWEVTSLLPSVRASSITSSATRSSPRTAVRGRSSRRPSSFMGS